MSSTYLSPSMPRLWIEADAPSRSATSRVSSMSTRALPPTRRMRATLPTRTPAMRTSDFSLSPATSSNCTEIVLPRAPAEPEVLDLPDEKSRQNEDDEKERADLRRIAHRASEMARCLALSDSARSAGPSARPSTNWRTAGSLDFMNSSGGASKRILPAEEQGEPVADLAGARDVVGDRHDGRLHLAADAEDDLGDDVGRDRVEAGVRLVEEQDLGLVRDGPREARRAAACRPRAPRGACPPISGSWTSSRHSSTRARTCAGVRPERRSGKATLS